MSSSDVIVVGPFPAAVVEGLERDQEVRALLGAAGEVRFVSHPAGSPEFAASVADATVVLGTGPYPSSCWDAAPRLRVVSVMATGYQTFLDVDDVLRRGIDIAYVPSYGAEAIAEHALALVLALAKGILPGDASVRGGGWRTGGSSVQLSGAVAGVIGLGAIGQHMVSLLSALGMEVLVWTRTRTPERLDGTTARYASLEEVVEAADVISLHLALTPETTGLLDGPLLDRAKPGAILVNTARSELLAPGSLEERVASGRLRAGVDVFRQEPPSPDDLLLSLGDGVVLSPHKAFDTPQAARSIVLGAARNVAAYLAGAPINLVTADTSAAPADVTHDLGTHSGNPVVASR